jgi:hypothetical protein
MTDTYFQLRYIQTSSRNAVNKKLFLTSLLFLGRSYRDVQHTNFRMSLKIKIVPSFSSTDMRQAEDC